MPHLGLHHTYGNFFQPPTTPGGLALQPELLESKTYHLWTPHSLINRVKIHFECKLDILYLSPLCVVLILSSLSLVLISDTMHCISRRNEFFPDRENTNFIECCRFLSSYGGIGKNNVRQRFCASHRNRARRRARLPFVCFAFVQKPLPREPKPKPRVVGIYHVNGRPVQAPLVSLSRERGMRYAYWLSAAVCFATQFSFTIS